MTDPNQGLMTLIRSKWGAQIAAACAGTAIPESFLAALVANESGGDQTKTRFEANVFAQICEVAAAKRAYFFNLGIQDLQLPPQFNLAMRAIVDYSTSWGLTQIMGYQALPFHRSFSVFSDPGEHLKFAVVLLIQFANRWDLDLGPGSLGESVIKTGPGAVSPALEKLFACWNCGQPFPEKTFDPHYCANGLLRMGLYGNSSQSTVES